MSVDTIGRYGDRHSANISTDTRPICRPSVGRVSVDMNRLACRPTPGRYFTATQPRLGRHSAATRPPLGRHSAATWPPLGRYFTNTKLTWSALGFKLILHGKAKALVIADRFCSHSNARGFTNRSKSLNQLQVIIFITIVVSKVREAALNL